MSSSRGVSVVVIGSGGREHALAWKLSRSPRVKRLIVAPGNAGMSQEWERWPANLAGGRDEFERLAIQAREERVDLVVVGPDNPLADGIVDVFNEYEIPCFGPTAGAAQIEASKAFAKEVMVKAGVPTAKSFVAGTVTEAEEFLKGADWSKGGWVVKADGLALGKGVHVCATQAEALAAVKTLATLTRSSRFVIEEKLSGEEISWMAFCDGDRCALLEPARDHKRLQDGDHGPNTGGMGAFSPVPGVPVHWAKRVREEVFLPTLREMKRRGVPFQGLLYAGLMVDIARDQIWVLEFNARFGDPETQVLLPRIADDLLEWCEASAQGDLSKLPESVPFVKDFAVDVVAAARGYPDSPEKGAPIALADQPLKAGAGPTAKNAQPEYFFAGVAEKNGVLVASGGRVLASVGMGASLEAARQQAYERLMKFGFDGMQFRKDIGGRA